MVLYLKVVVNCSDAIIAKFIANDLKDSHLDKKDLKDSLLK